MANYSILLPFFFCLKVEQHSLAHQPRSVFKFIWNNVSIMNDANNMDSEVHRASFSTSYNSAVLPLIRSTVSLLNFCRRLAGWLSRDPSDLLKLRKTTSGNCPGLYSFKQGCAVICYMRRVLYQDVSFHHLNGSLPNFSQATSFLLGKKTPLQCRHAQQSSYSLKAKFLLREETPALDLGCTCSKSSPSQIFPSGFRHRNKKTGWIVLKGAEEQTGPPKCRKGNRAAPQGLLGVLKRKMSERSGKRSCDLEEDLEQLGKVTTASPWKWRAEEG